MLCRQVDSNRSMSGRLGSLSKSLSQVLSLPATDRRDRDVGKLAAADSAAAAGVALAVAVNAMGTAVAVDDSGLPPHSVAVALPAM